MSRLLAYQVIQESADKWPTRSAIVDDERTLTFGELRDAVEQLKEALLAQGVASGHGVGLVARNSPEFIIGMFAALGCGATVLPISHQLTSSERDQIFASAPLHAVLASRNDDRFAAAGTESLGVEPFTLQWRRPVEDAPLVSHINHPALIRFTSGTTGSSKGVILSHASVIERVDAAQKGMCLTPDDTIIWVLPMAYHFVVSLVLYLRYGATIAISKDLLAENILTCAAANNGTVLYCAPVHIRMLASDESGVISPSLKTVISTSAALGLSVAELFTKRYGIPVTQAFGIIEVGLPLINRDACSSSPGAVGHALPDYEVGILDEHGGVLPPGETGNLGLKGPGMFDAYLNPPRLRDEVTDRHGWFLTGDLAVCDEHGLVTIQGREKAVINVSGNKVFPEEVEAVLEECPGVIASRVYGGTHPLVGELVEAELVVEDNADLEQIRNFCRSRLSPYKVPQRMKAVASIMETATGKKARA